MSSSEAPRAPRISLPKDEELPPWVSELDLGPLLRSRSSEDAARMELLSIFGYRREGDVRSYALLPLMFEISGGRPRFAPETWTRMWPLLYHDPDRRVVDCELLVH